MERTMRRFFTPLAVLLLVAAPTFAQAPRRPNVILIMTDDQGHGDLGFHGNPIIKTPHLDAFAKQSVRMKHFYVSPVCSPTRASLLTGRYNYRTGVVDTFIGRSMMHLDEVTIAELLSKVGYRTGIFGKWHLGDCYPLRPIDQGFSEALVHKGGGIGQPSDPPGGESYFDPILQHNGTPVRKKGYCSDIYVDAALEWIAQEREKPFFCYIPFNAPHGPHECPENYRALYDQTDFSFDKLPKIGFPLPVNKKKAKQTELDRVYGMITNIDDNVGRLLAKLDELKIADNTIVIFLTDNGASFPRYNSGMRGFKGSVFEGGTRVPFFVRWPAKLPGDREVDRIAAHIDVMPTLLAACGFSKEEGQEHFDGKNLLPLWRGDDGPWPDRTLHFQWHRGDVPELYRACAARSQRWRLVQPAGVPEGAKIKEPRFMLFDIEKDPYEQHDVAAANPDVVAKMKKGYEEWFADVKKSREFAPPRIHVGSEKEPLTVLTRQDWRGPKAGWTPLSVGHWEVLVEKAGAYDVTVHLPKGETTGTVHLRFGDVQAEAEANGGSARLRGVKLPSGPGRLEVVIGDGETPRGVRYVEVQKAK
jgi:arylsulfatase A-like enzyme